MQLTKPKKLNIGDVIGIISPSAGLYPIFPHRFKNGVKMIKKMGFKVKFAKNSKKNLGYVSGTIQQRVDDIHEMFLDNDVKCIICSIGGNHSNQLLKYLNFKIIENNPKIFIGYSDISVLHYAFMKKAKLQTFYGPCLMTQFGEFPSLLEYTLYYFNKTVTDNKIIGEIKLSDDFTSEILDWTKKDDLKRPRKLFKSSGYEWLKSGKAGGIIIGGCIPSINHLVGTKYWINPKNAIFFIDIPEGDGFGEGLSIYYLDSYLADLDNLGLFSSIKGLIIGRPYNYSQEQIENLKNIILNYTKNYDYPILYNVNIGHCDPIITLPLGAEVLIDSSKNLFYINEKGVR